MCRAHGLTDDDEILSHLPLCLPVARLVAVEGAITAGYVVNFGEPGNSGLASLRDVQPTFLIAGSHAWEAMYEHVTIRIRDAGWLKRRAYAFWIAVGHRVASRREPGGRGVRDRIAYALGWCLIYRSVRTKLGLRRVRVALAGPEPIAQPAHGFFDSIGLDIHATSSIPEAWPSVVDLTNGGQSS
jgi:long-chain acyl-CoA synthetase